MTRINTNVSSLMAQKTLAKSNVSLQTSLTRLSTGLRINVGKDDPAGLIASEALRSDITSTQKAITNSQRANQMIGTADSALGQASSLLNDIRGLVTEAANVGALSDQQIAANQLQVDSSLEALNRISQTTSFQGKRLLDGSLDFITTATANFDDVTDMNIDQASLGTTGSMAVEVAITAAATQAEITATVAATGAAIATFDWEPIAGNTLTIEAPAAGSAYNGVDVVLVEDAGIVATAAEANYNSVTSTLTIKVSSIGATDTTMATILAAIEADTDFTASGDAGDYTSGTVVSGTVVGELGDDTVGADASSGLTGALVFELRGTKGTEVFNFADDTTGAQMAAAINLVSDATGVTAVYGNPVVTTLYLTSTDYGEGAFVEYKEISDAGAFTPSATRVTGTDIAATVNGVTADGDGNTLTINTATLDMTTTIAAGETDTIQFSITGGGALFQLGPDVVSNQQARVGITSVNAGSLGGTSGRLFTLGSGGTNALATDATTAAEIVDQVIAKVTSLRGRLGALQRTTIDSNINTLSDTLENLTDAESSIRDADFAAETASLTRAQILVQSGVSVLGIANSNPQNVLALLR